MDVNFNQPQRQSKVGVIVMLADTVYAWAKLLWIYVFIWILMGKTEKIIPLLPYIGVFLILVSLLAYLRYLNFTFYIDSDKEEFIISDGVLNKTKTIVQLNKIQQVNISQSLIQKIIGVYGLDIDTAGADAKEARIRAVSHELALDLKSKLLQNEVQKTETTVVSESTDKETLNEVPFLKINLFSLFKIGITSNYVKTIGLIITFYLTILEDLKRFGFDYFPDDKIEKFFESNTVLYLALTFILLVVSIVFVINVGRTLIKFFDYTVAKQKGSLVLTHGLINTKSTLLKPEKVQMVIISRNYFQKKLDVLSLKIKQTVGYLEDKNENIIEIPGCNAMEKGDILKLIFNQLPEKGTMMKPNFRMLVFSVFLKIVLPLIGFYLFAKLLVPELLEYFYYPATYAALLFLYLFFEFKNYRLFVSDNYIFKQGGAWDIENQIIQLDKIQALTTSQLFWHKGLNIGTLKIHTAGGNIIFQLGKFDKINELVNLWLYKIEKSDVNWM